MAKPELVSSVEERSLRKIFIFVRPWFESRSTPKSFSSSEIYICKYVWHCGFEISWGSCNLGHRTNSEKLSSMTQPLSKRDNIAQRNWPYDAHALRQMGACICGIYNLLRNSTSNSTKPTLQLQYQSYNLTNGGVQDIDCNKPRQIRELCDTVRPPGWMMRG